MSLEYLFRMQYLDERILHDHPIFFGDWVLGGKTHALSQLRIRGEHYADEYGAFLRFQQVGNLMSYGIRRHSLVSFLLPLGKLIHPAKQRIGLIGMDSGELNHDHTLLLVPRGGGRLDSTNRTHPDPGLEH